MRPRRRRHPSGLRSADGSGSPSGEPFVDRGTSGLREILVLTRHDDLRDREIRQGADVAGPSALEGAPKKASPVPGPGQRLTSPHREEDDAYIISKKPTTMFLRTCSSTRCSRARRRRNSSSLFAKSQSAVVTNNLCEAKPYTSDSCCH